MRKQTYYLLAVLAVLILTVRLQGCAAERDAAWRADRERIVAVAEHERARAVAAMQRAAQLTAEAGRQTARADSLEFAAWVAGKEAERIRARIDTVEVPASALPYTAPRDSIIAVQDMQITQLTGALQAEREANASLLEANKTLETSVRGLTTTVDSLLALVKRAPGERWYVPKVTIGVAAGMDMVDGGVFAGPSVNVGWKVRF